MRIFGRSERIKGAKRTEEGRVKAFKHRTETRLKPAARRFSVSPRPVHPAVWHDADPPVAAARADEAAMARDVDEDYLVGQPERVERRIGGPAAGRVLAGHAERRDVFRARIADGRKRAQAVRNAPERTTVRCSSRIR